MKKNPVYFQYPLLTVLFVLNGIISSAQLYIPAGASLNMTGSSVLYAGSSVINSGTLNAGTGTVVLAANLTDNGTFNAGSGQVNFTGDQTQNLSLGSAASLNNVTIDKSANDVIVQSNMPTINGTLSLTNGKLDIGNYDLTIAGTVSGGSASSYVKTSGTGKLNRNIAAAESFIFPVGNSSFNSLSVTNNNPAADVFSSRVTDEVLDAGLSGSVISRGRVRRTWDIQKTNANSGNGVNLVFNYSTSETTGLSNPIMNHFNNGYWNPQYGTTSSNLVSQFSYSGYKGDFSLFSLQDYYTSNLTLRAFIQGYYKFNSPPTMVPAMLNSGGIVGATFSQTDNIVVSLHNAENGEQTGAAVTTILGTDGFATAVLNGVASPHYIVVNHRNALETWSANPVSFSPNATYDFSTAANKAYGNNLKGMSNGIFAIYSGDLNKDGVIESADYAKMENDVLSILFGYVVSDITGDGVVESFDYALLENNIFEVIFVQRPF